MYPRSTLAVNPLERQPGLSFIVMIGFLINLVRKSLQIELDNYLDHIHCPQVSKQAFSEARQKLKPEAFLLLNHELVEAFYSDNDFQTYKGYLLLTCDGSALQLPNTKDLIDEFGYSSNQYGKGIAMAKTSALHDQLNGITIDGILSPYPADERVLAMKHVENSKDLLKSVDKKLILFDMGYPAYYFMHYLPQQGYDFLIRCAPNFIPELQEMVSSDQSDQILEITIAEKSPAIRAKFKELFPLNSRPVLSLRVVIVKLEDGTLEFLLTSLLDSQQFPYDIFLELYDQRWGAETNFGIIKTRLEIEDFTGKTPMAIKQDFHATLFTHNVRALAVMDAQEELDQQNKGKSLKYDYKINNNLTIGTLKNKIVDILLESGDLDGLYSKIVQQIKRQAVPIRPNRNFSRKRKQNRRKYHMNLKRAL